MTLPLGCELALLVGAHESRGQTESPEGEVALRALAGIVDEGDGVLVGALVVELVLDEVHVDEVAHGGACVPTNVVRINVDLLEVSDHLILVGDVLLLSGSSSGELGGIVLVAVGSGGVDGREREGVGDFEETFTLHSNNSSGRNRRESRRAVLGNLHNNLRHHELISVLLLVLQEGVSKGGACSTHQSLDLNSLERRGSRRIVLSVRHLDKNSGGVIHGAARDGESFGAMIAKRTSGVARPRDSEGGNIETFRVPFVGVVGCRGGEVRQIIYPALDVAEPSKDLRSSPTGRMRRYCDAFLKPT